MRREIIKAQIIDILDAIIEQTQVINEHKGRIPQIEIDLIKKNISELYETYCVLDKMNQEDVSEKKSSKTEIINDLVAPTEEKAKTQITEKAFAEVEIVEEKKPKEEIKVETPIEPITKNEENISTKIVVEKEAEPEIKKEPIIESAEIKKSTPEPIKVIVNPNPTTIADKFKNENKTLNDSIENKEDKSIVSKMQKAPITDLIKAIGINERFLFTKELFKNDSEQYGPAIKSLNEMSGLSEAFDYLDELKTKMDWDENSSACLKIYDLIRRKYQPKT